MPGPLVEGVDYYMENGKLVFTADYHLKRGYCCNSRCRHCPYGLSPIGEPVRAAPFPVVIPPPGMKLPK